MTLSPINDLISLPADILFCAQRPLPCLSTFGMTLLVQKNFNSADYTNDNLQETTLQKITDLSYRGYKSIFKPIVGLYLIYKMNFVNDIFRKLQHPDYQPFPLLFPSEAGYSLAKKVLKYTQLIFGSSQS